MLRHDGARRWFRLHRLARTPRPSELDKLPAAGLLLTPSLPAGTQRRLADAGWSWVTNTGQVRLRFGRHIVEHDNPAAGFPAASGNGVLAGGLGTFAVLRRLLLDRPRRQVDLAASVGLTQPRVSQILRQLADAGLIERRDRAWAVPDWTAAVDAWHSGYPGPGGVRTYWAGLGDPWESTFRALDVLPTAAVIGGDVGADLLAPWRHPRHATIYTRELTDLRQAELIQIGTATEAVLTVCVPKDKSVSPVSEIVRTFRDRALRVADPLQVLWDVRQRADADSRQAANHLLESLRAEHAKVNVA